MEITTSRPILEGLFDHYLYSALVVGGIVFLFYVYSIIRYRYISGQEEPKDAPQAGVIPPLRGNMTVGALLAIVLILLFIPISVATYRTVDLIERPPLEGPINVKVEGVRFAWNFTYPNGLKQTNELIVPKDKVIILKATSKDVMHTFYVPDFKLMVDAIPGHTNIVWFKALQLGSYEVSCNELCGAGHTIMKAKVIVKEPEEFEKWYEGGK